MLVPFEPGAFAQLASALVDQPALGANVRSRTVIGRAYYALFLAVRVKFEAAGLLSRDARIGHGELQRRIRSSPHALAASLSVTLGALADARRVADYQMRPTEKWSNIVDRPSSARWYLRRTEAALRDLERIDPRDLR